MAGRISYIGVQTVLDFLFGHNKQSRKSADWYQSALAGIDQTVTDSFITANQILRIARLQDGIKSSKIAELALKEAENLINWMYPILQLTSLYRI